MGSKRVLLVAAIALSVATPAWCGDSLEARAGGLITAEALLDTVRWLSSEPYGGRSSGLPGYDRAADEMARRFAAAGLDPAVEGSHLQPLTVEVNEFLSSPRLAVVGEDGTRRALTLGEDFVARGFSGAGAVTGEVVFCGYGIHDPERGWTDYGGQDLAGKVVLVFKQPPAWHPDDVGWGEVHLPRPKASAAALHGAVAVLMVSRPDARWGSAIIGSQLHGPGEHPARVPQLQVTAEVAAELLAPTGSTLEQLQARIDEGRAPQVVATGSRVAIEVETRYDPAGATANVVGILRGSDPDAGHVVLGAHLDHVGAQGELLFPGANDDGSGSAIVLAVAEAFAAVGVRPKRSVVFVLFASEEQGTHGSEAYVQSPVLPIDEAVAMINLDCVGLGNGLRLGGRGASPVLNDLARQIDARTGPIVIEDSWYSGGADADAFFHAGVPTLYFATEDGYAHLHQPTDTVDTLDPELFTAVARLVLLTTEAVADGRYEAREERQPPPPPDTP